MSTISIPSISVIIPAYNAQHYLSRCIDSVLNQSVSDIELIVVDDGSSDETAEICGTYATKDKRMKVIHQQNKGVSTARNTGLQVATGKWVTFVDADDMCLQEGLKSLYEKGEKTDADIVLAEAYTIREDKKKKSYTLSDETYCGNSVVDKICHPALWGYLFKREKIMEHQIRFVDGLAYSEDRVFLYKLASHCRSIAYLPIPVYMYYVHAGSACGSKDGLRKAYHQFWAASELNKYFISQHPSKSVWGG